MWDKTNGPIRRTALILGSADGTSIITIANVGGVLYATYPDGTTAPLGGGARAVQVLAADLVVTASLAAYVYANGTAGVGATLTANAVGVFGNQDSVASVAGYVYLVPPSVVSDPKYAGLYVLTTRGAPVTTKAVLTRSVEFDSPEDMKDGTLFEIRLGTLYGNKGPWQLTGDVATVGTDAVTITRAPNLMLLDTAQTVTGPKTFDASTLKQSNAAGTFAHTFASNASAARTITAPDADLTIAQSGVASGSSGTGAVTGATASDGAVATSSDGSGAIGGAMDSTTATMVAEARSGFLYAEAPATAAANAGGCTVVVDVVVAGGAQIIAAQPDHPRKLILFITDGNSSISAGTLDLVGVGPSGEAVTESIDLTGGTASKTSTQAYATLTSATVSNLAGNEGGDKIALGAASALGLVGCKTPASGGFAVHKALVDGAAEAVGTVDAAAGTIVPTTVPNGAHNYAFFYTYAVTATQNSHTHTNGTLAGPAHTHTGGAHTHSAGTLAGPAHTHTQT